jgi:hypothetical protein
MIAIATARPPQATSYLVLCTQYFVLSTEYAVLRWPSLFAALLTVLFFTAALAAQDPPPKDDAVEQGRQALSNTAKFPWYDRRQDDVRPLHLVPRSDADSANRSSKWTGTDKQTTGGGRRTGALGPVLQWIGLTALIILLGVIAYLVATAFLKEEISEGAAQRRVVETSRDVDRVESLPFHVRKPSGDFLSEARRLYEAGQFSESIIYLFSYQLVQLDRHQVIRLAKGKTNRQYVRETRQRPAVRPILEQTMYAFEDAFFGHKTLTREQFERCWRQLDEFHAELDRLERAAA